MMRALHPLLAVARVYAEPIFGEAREDQIQVRSYNRSKREWDEVPANRASVAVGFRFWNLDLRLAEGEEPRRHLHYVEVGPLTAVGYDRGDKASGKATTYAAKGCIKKMFGIATGEDVDQGEALEVAPAPRRLSEPTLSAEPHDLAMNIPERAWQTAVSHWTGTPCSSDQRRLLYAKASAKKWTHDDIRAVVKHHLGVELEDVPGGRAFDCLLKAFTEFEPSEVDFGEPGEQPDLDL